MKALLLVAGLLVGLSGLPAYAQNAEYFTYASLPVDSTTHLVTFTGVVPVAGATKAQLYTRAVAWAALFFRENERAPQLANPAMGTYSCRGIVRLPYGTTYFMVLTVEARDESYTYRINQLFYAYSASTSDALSGTINESAEHWATYKKKNLHYVDVRIHEVHQFLPQLLAGLQAMMSRPG